MTSSIIKLFSGGRRLARFWDTLELELHDACAMQMARDPSLHQGTLFYELRKRFTLQPIELCDVEDVTIAGHETRHITSGVELPGFKASAKVRFFGSKVLLQTPPEPGYRFPYHGRSAKTFLHLHSHLPDLDARAFVADVRREVARIKPALAAFAPRVADYDARLRERVEQKIRTF